MNWPYTLTLAFVILWWLIFGGWFYFITALFFIGVQMYLDMEVQKCNERLRVIEAELREMEAQT